MQTVRLDIHIKPVNINLLSASFVPIIPVFLSFFFFFIYPPEYSLPSFYTRLIFKSNDRFFAFPVFHKKIFPAYTHYPLTIFHSLVTWLNQNLARYLMYHFSTCTIFKTRPEFNPRDSTNERISIFHTVHHQISRDVMLEDATCRELILTNSNQRSCYFLPINK